MIRFLAFFVTFYIAISPLSGLAHTQNPTLARMSAGFTHFVLEEGELPSVIRGSMPSDLPHTPLLLPLWFSSLSPSVQIGFTQLTYGPVELGPHDLESFFVNLRKNRLELGKIAEDAGLLPPHREPDWKKFIRKSRAWQKTYEHVELGHLVFWKDVVLLSYLLYPDYPISLRSIPVNGVRKHLPPEFVNTPFKQRVHSARDSQLFAYLSSTGQQNLLRAVGDGLTLMFPLTLPTAHELKLDFDSLRNAAVWTQQAWLTYATIALWNRLTPYFVRDAGKRRWRIDTNKGLRLEDFTRIKEIVEFLGMELGYTGTENPETVPQRMSVARRHLRQLRDLFLVDGLVVVR